MKELPPKQELVDLYDKMFAHLQKQIPMVWGHADFHIKNMVFDPDSGNYKIQSYLERELRV